MDGWGEGQRWVGSWVFNPGRQRRLCAVAGLKGRGTRQEQLFKW